jgi:hypothetical protein
VEENPAAAGLSPRVLEMLTAACQERPTYLDKFYALQPGRPNGAKRLIVLLPSRLRAMLDGAWLDEVSTVATVVWRGAAGEVPPETELEAHEFAWVS